jgi:hypothetical protein
MVVNQHDGGASITGGILGVLVQILLSVCFGLASGLSLVSPPTRLANGLHFGRLYEKK